MFKIVDKREISPNNHEFIIKAPAIAKKANPGQFAILMVDEKSERVPYTLCDWDAEAGTVTLVVQEMGQSSRKLVLLGVGDSVAHLVGPLGVPLEIDKFGTVVVAGGCYGLGASLTIARAMKAAGNRVITIMEARSHYLHYYREDLEAASDELIQTTIDGSEGKKGHAVDAIEDKIDAGETLDRVIAIGCPFMMMIIAEKTKPAEIKTLAALNPIMLDGTGMCGACRVSVGNDTKFACVDGPFFDAHEVDWGELWDRKAAYSREETDSMADTSAIRSSGGSDSK